MPSAQVWTAIVLGFYLLASAWEVGRLFAPARFAPRAARWLGGLAFLCLSALLAWAAASERRLPFRGLGETLLSLGWLVGGSALWLSREGRLPSLLPFALPTVGLLVFMSLFTAGHAWQAQGALMALHGGTSLVGYAAFATAFLTGLMYLVAERVLRSRRGWAVLEGFPSLETLDRWNARAIQWGFPFLTVAFLTGVSGARQAWGRGWAAEPVVVGVAATWLLYGGLVLARSGFKLHGSRVSLLTVLAFGVGMLSLGAGWLLGGNH